MTQSLHTKRISGLRKGTFRFFWGFFFLLTLAAGTAFLSACTSTRLPQTGTEALLPATIAWQQQSPGIQTFSHSIAGQPARYHVVRIELAGRRIRVDAYPPPSADGDGSFAPQDIRRFASSCGCSVAVNTTPFMRAQAGRLRAAGIHKVRGIQRSAPEERYAALALSGQQESDGSYTQLRAAVIGSQTSAACDVPDFVFGGFFVILKDGDIVPFSTESYDSRSAAGTNADGSVLWLLCAEGERSWQSKGLSFQQCARILKELGCTDALQFDGGGAAQLCVGGASLLPYTPPHAYGCCMGLSPQ